MITVILTIGIPVLLAIIGGTVGMVRAIIRFTQYMSRSEESQESIAASNVQIRDKLDTFIDRTETHFGRVDEKVAVLMYAMGVEPGNGYVRRSDREAQDRAADRREHDREEIRQKGEATDVKD